MKKLSFLIFCFSILSFFKSGAQCTPTTMNAQAIVTSNNISCKGQANGKLNLYYYSSNGVYPYTWEWRDKKNTILKNGIATAKNTPFDGHISNLSAGEYFLYTCNANGQQFSISQFIISEPEYAPIPTITSSDTTNCPGSIITLTATVKNGFSPYTYYWSSPDDSTFANMTNTVSVSSLQSHIYIVSAMDVNGCLASSSFTITPKDCGKVWPGDADNNGVADVMDLLPIGLHYNENGPTRDSTSILWMAHASENWGVKQSGGLDINSVDCDGNGSIDNKDIIAIEKNYGFMHNKAEQNFEPDPTVPDLYLVSSDFAAPGDTLHFEVWAGRDTLPVKNLYGVAFNLYFQKDAAIDPPSVKIDYTSTLITDSNSDFVSLFKYTEIIRRIDGSVVRTDKTNKVGSGKIADVYFKLKNNYPSSDFTLYISDYKAITSSGANIKLNPKSKSVTLISTAMHDQSHLSEIDVYPNPSNGTFIIKNSSDEKSIISMVNILGETVLQTESSGTITEVKTHDLPKGIYWIYVNSPARSAAKKVVVY